MKANVQASAALLGLVGAMLTPVASAVPIHAAVPASRATPAVPAIPAVAGLPGDGAIRALRAIPAVPPSPVPEAGTYAMMLTGLGLIGMMVARRRVY